MVMVLVVKTPDSFSRTAVALTTMTVSDVYPNCLQPMEQLGTDRDTKAASQPVPGKSSGCCRQTLKSVFMFLGNSLVGSLMSVMRCPVMSDMIYVFLFLFLFLGWSDTISFSRTQLSYFWGQPFQCTNTLFPCCLMTHSTRKKSSLATVTF